MDEKKVYHRKCKECGEAFEASYYNYLVCLDDACRRLQRKRWDATYRRRGQSKDVLRQRMARVRSWFEQLEEIEQAG